MASAQSMDLFSQKLLEFRHFPKSKSSTSDSRRQSCPGQTWALKEAKSGIADTLGTLVLVPTTSETTTRTHISYSMNHFIYVSDCVFCADFVLFSLQSCCCCNLVCSYGYKNCGTSGAKSQALHVLNELFPICMCLVLG